LQPNTAIFLKSYDPENKEDKSLGENIFDKFLVVYICFFICINLINFSYVTFLMCLYYIDPNGELCKYLKGVAEAEDVQSYVKTNAFGLPAITNTHTDWIYYSRIRYRAGNKIRLYIMDELNYI
jgi:hypothetical protein